MSAWRRQSFYATGDSAETDASFLHLPKPSLPVTIYRIDGEPVSIVLLNSFGKLTPFGDSNRLRKWMLANS